MPDSLPIPKSGVARARGSDEFDGADRLVLEATDKLLADGRAREMTWLRLVKELGTHQATDAKPRLFGGFPSSKSLYNRSARARSLSEPTIKPTRIRPSTPGA
ncbi:hypothetical protein MNVI_30350 [Mycobacterium noviomagense]|uniref:Uncharacterized protein n=1 Tax=Mycobacterium noviomagense TaxID=459858 RepID=A0A7I7PGH3_9MYCO|nr:hypothetical protein MNVI_30350 [Mycobacterium noviomagense]